MVEFTLPRNSKITEGRKWPRSAHATHVSEFRIYRWNPDDGQNPSVDTYYVDRDDCGPDGSRCADLDQEQHRPHPHLPAIMPRRRMWLLRHEYRRHQHACLYQGDRRCARAGENLSAAASACGEGPGARSEEFLRAICLDRAMAADRRRPRPKRSGGNRTRTVPSSTACTNAYCVPVARRLARATGGIQTAISARLRCCRQTAGSRIAATKRPARVSTILRIRSGSIAAIRS